MAFKRKLPMSAALREGGAGVTPPPTPDMDLGQLKGPKAPAAPKGPTNLGLGLKSTGVQAPKPPAAPKAPTLPTLKAPKLKASDQIKTKVFK